jgi:light-regulated signal transduction histidine kinase (bacteriophytochrome)
MTEFKYKILAKEDRLLMERKHDNVLLQRLSFIFMFLAILLAGYSLFKLYKRIGPLINDLNLANANLWNSIQEKNKEIELRKQAELKNDEYINLLTSKNAELNHFAYIASHDLQEPLRTVNNFIEVFKEDYGEKLDEDAHQYFDFIFGATHRMKALIEGLLNYSRLGKSKWAEMVDIKEVMAITRANLAATIALKKAVVHEVGTMPSIVCMKTEMTQLFQNLINNAIKYTAPNVVPKISITAEDKGSHWEFCVADNGIGIPAEHQTRIFNMFSRLHGEDVYQGQGIGLAFCKKIVELHDGNIWVKSEPGEGSLFYFTISKKLKDETEAQQHLAD